MIERTGMMKILYISHSPSLKTGFGMVSRHICQGFHARGAEIVCLGSGQTEEGFDPSPFPFKIRPVPREDYTGWTLFPSMLRDEKPDLIFLNFELMACAEWINIILRETRRVPILLYYSIEGFPIYKPWHVPIKLADAAVTYTRFGSEKTKVAVGREVPHLYHGVDRQTFFPLPEEQREAIKEKLGWSGRFVVTFVGVNRLSKQQPKLIEAISLLRQQGMEDIYCYLHCHPFEKHRYGGWNLAEIANVRGVADRIIFRDGSAADFLARQKSKEKIAEPPPSASLMERYNATDLYLHPSKVEGFGLPLIEAMACGIPLAHTDDGSVMNEICGEVGHRIPVADHDYATFGAKYFILSAEKIAETILYFRRALVKKESLRYWREAGPERAKAFDWDRTSDGFMEIARKLLQGK